MVLLVSGQVLAGLVFGYLGLFGVAATSLTFGKIAGAVMVILGVWLATYK
jgi:transporter family-2 protein